MCYLRLVLPRPLLRPRLLPPCFLLILVLLTWPECVPRNISSLFRFAAKTRLPSAFRPFSILFTPVFARLTADATAAKSLLSLRAVLFSSDISYYTMRTKYLKPGPYKFDAAAGRRRALRNPPLSQKRDASRISLPRFGHSACRRHPVWHLQP